MKVSLVLLSTLVLFETLHDCNVVDAQTTADDAEDDDDDDDDDNKEEEDEDDDPDLPYKLPFSLEECLAKEARMTTKCDYTFDGECDVWEPTGAKGDSGGNCIHGTDCYDCNPDPCKKHNYNCGDCIEAGCWWCGGDGLCSSEPITKDILEPFNKITSCPYEDYWHDHCKPWSYSNLYEDGLYDAMHWAYEMINLEPVWDMGYTGKGIHVRINDDGVDAHHPEFINKFDVKNSCPQYLPSLEPEEGTNTTKLGDHGTACASLLLAGANGVGAVGIAPDATASSCVLIGAGADEREEGARIYHAQEFVNISSNSWGPDPCTAKDTEEGRRYHARHLAEVCPFNPNHPESPCGQCLGSMDTKVCKEAVSNYCSEHYEVDPAACSNYLDWFVTCGYAPLPSDAGGALTSGVLEGRDGLGIIFVWAAGNEYKSGADMNGDAYSQSRFTISVAAVGKDGLHASYSTPGACNFIAAPGGDDEYISNNIVAKPGGGYHDISVGTSFATPTVSGVVALMLQANPKLGWRDVQGILALTARPPPGGLDDSWVTNGAGLKHSNKYGFGIIDAALAVNVSLTWDNWGKEQQIKVDSGDIHLPIENDASITASSSLQLETPSSDFVAEMVSVYLDLDHASRGDLLITLTSPSGTESVLHPSRRPERTVGLSHWKLSTVKNYLEDPAGTWTLRIVDEHPQKGVPGNHQCNDIYYWAFREKPDGTLLGYYDCHFFKTDGWCKDGEVINAYVDAYPDNESPTLLGSMACCECGGGSKMGGRQEQLVSWSMVVYGHEE